jgi:type II restriction enzyme
VADAKSFRLSRTAKNQKDFKVQAMDNWKRGKPYAVVVCPIYQLPSRSSQIYQQAASRNVCIFTYSHLSVLASVSDLRKNSSAQSLLLKIMKSVSALNPSKDAIAYWTTINRTMIHYSPEVEELWKIEKKASVESINYAKEEALNYFAHQREKIMTMPHDEAIRELIRVHKIDNRVSVIKSVVDNGLLSIM